MTKLTADQLKEIKAAMLKKNFKYRQSNGIDNYLHAAILQGIEMKGTNINPFVVGDDGERVYGYDQVGNETRAAVSIIEQILMEDAAIFKGTTGTEQDAPKQEVETKKAVETKELHGILPKRLTQALLDEKNHPGSIAVLINSQITDEEYLKEAPGGGGRTMTYVEGNVMKRHANYAFRFNWDSEILDKWESEKEVMVQVKCIFKFTEGFEIHRTEIGGADKKFSKTKKGKDKQPLQIMVADTWKAAVTDAIKCCLRDEEMDSDLYSGDRKCQKKTK